MSMFELSKSDYEKIRPLVHLHDDHLATYGVLAGTVPAQVYVDDLKRPATFFFRAGHRYSLAGDWNNTSFNTSLRKLFLEQIYPEEQQKGNVAFQLYYAPEGWAESIEQVLAGKRLTPIRRQYYEFKHPQPDWRKQLPDGFVMAFVDRDFLDTYKSLRSIDLLLEEMCSERPTVDDFL